MSDLSYEQQSYEIDDIWKKLSTSERDLQRVEYVAALIPEDARTVLDVGCGSGIFINYLYEHANRFDRLCGVDRSVTALKYVKAEKKEADVAKLPFGDQEFDVVACLEVIEHLPQIVYRNALKELCRVSRRYVVVTVPNNESLALSHVTCPFCCTRFSANYHMRSFNRQAIVNLLSPHGFRNTKVFFVGEVEDYYIGLRWYTKLSALRSKSFCWYAICPVCGHRGDAASQPNPDTDSRGSFRTLIKRIWPKKRKGRWIGGLFERAASPASEAKTA